jgi:carboxyl-terminal processing protease
MNGRSGFLTILIFSLSFVLSACIGLIPLEDKPITGKFGPQLSLQEQQAKTFEALWKDLKENYIYYETADVDWDVLHDKYLGRLKTGLTSDEFTALIEDLQADLPEGSLIYESRAQRIERQTADSSTYEGIGAFVGFSGEPQPHIILLDVIVGSPAEKAGLQAHDSIFEIDGEPILLDEGLDAVDRVRGPAGSSVTLGIQSPGAPRRSVEVKRGKLASTGKLQASKVKGTNYGYLLFPPIGYDTLAEDVVQSLQSFTANRKLDGVILDLRIANSSRGWPLEALYSLFGNGAIGEFYNRNNKQLLQVKGQDVGGSQDVPLVILVGENTNGLPEVFAASLQMHKRATVIGETTPGAVETTSSFYLPDGSQAFIESTSFRLPNGAEVGSAGVAPDVSLEVGWDEVLPDRDPVLDRALETLDDEQ